MPGVSASVYTNPADTCVALPQPERLAYLEIEALECAWQLGAWDVRRMEHAPLANPDAWREPRYGVANDFGINPYTITVCGSDPTVLTHGDHADDKLIKTAARHGWITWVFVPLALATPIMQQRWRDKDRTLSDAQACTRTPRRITGVGLHGPCEVGTAYDHIYELGRANHGNRSKKSRERRG